jgi:hypothetical protein
VKCPVEEEEKIDVKLMVFLLFQFVVQFALCAWLDVGILALQM